MSKTCFYEYKFLNMHIATKYFQKLTFELMYLQGFKHYFQSLSRGRLACCFPRQLSRATPARSSA